MSVDQVRVHIVSRSPQCSMDLEAFLAHQLGGGLREHLPALIQTAPPLVGGVAKPSPKLPRG